MATAAAIQILPSISQTTTSDSDVALAAAGDRREFERLYRSNVNRVYSICVRMVVDRTRAEELTQDVFVRAWDKLHQFRGESSFSTWLHRMAVNLVLNARKSDSRLRSKFEEQDEEQGLDALPAASSQMIGAGEMLDLEAAIAKLPPGARRVFVLHDVEGFKHEEIAQQMGVTTGATKAQLHRARMLLRQTLSR
ncbi:MAG TPA: sigma-70 family RNA polymerase sigma factor [Gemmatimonadaceae bacterium]